MSPGRNESLDLTILVVIDIEHLRTLHKVEEFSFAVLAERSSQMVEMITTLVAIGTRRVKVALELTKKIKLLESLCLLLRDAKITHQMWYDLLLKSSQGICLARTM